MKYFQDIQMHLEDVYGALTGLDVRDFVRSTQNFPKLGELIIEQNPGSEDLNLALLFDRDIFEACGASLDASSDSQSSLQTLALHRALSVSFEEVSHFVYLSFNHNRGRNITSLELEIQSEVDRVLLACHSPLSIDQHVRDELISEVFEKPYSANVEDRYETARKIASRFLRLVGSDPRAWTKFEFDQLRIFFHNDLSGKIHLSKNL